MYQSKIQISIIIQKTALQKKKFRFYTYYIKSQIYIFIIFNTICMESEYDDLDIKTPPKQYEGIYSFPYELQSPKLEPYLLNQYGQQALEMPQSVKLLNQIYPLNQTIEARQQQIKRFFGLKFLFGLEDKNQKDFLEDINSQIFNASFFQNPNLIDLNKLFQDEDINSQQIQHKKQIDDLTKKLGEIHNKAFSGISIQKTIGKAFYDHFLNFHKLQSQSTFLHNFQESFEKFFYQSKKIKKCGPHLILMIYQFWMRMFRQFVKQIWKHSQKYSDDIMFKKKKDQQCYNYQNVNSSLKSNRSSTSSSQQGQKMQKDKRKPWSKYEIQTLQKIIDSNAIFNNIRLQKLAQQFGRSSISIASKIQKLKKNKNQPQLQQQISTEKKIEFVLKLYPQGLTKQQVVKKISQVYQMGLQDNWKKSVCQILSSKKNIIKIKSSFRLTNPQNYYQQNLCETQKDKLIKCFLHCQNYQCDLKGLSQKYIQLFSKQEGINQNEKQKMKIIENNISKCLNRYQIFQKTNQRVIYKLKEFDKFNKCDYSMDKCEYSMDVEDYIE